MTKQHELKVHKPFFDRLGENGKTFEVRRNDRDFQVNDSLMLREYDAIEERYLTGIKTATITYILTGGKFGIEEGYVVLQLKFHNPQP